MNAASRNVDDVVPAWRELEARAVGASESPRPRLSSITVQSERRSSSVTHLRGPAPVRLGQCRVSGVGRRSRVLRRRLPASAAGPLKQAIRRARFCMDLEELEAARATCRRACFA
jgi:hypothetical protein